MSHVRNYFHNVFFSLAVEKFLALSRFFFCGCELNKASVRLTDFIFRGDFRVSFSVAMMPFKLEYTALTSGFFITHEQNECYSSWEEKATLRVPHNLILSLYNSR